MNELKEQDITNFFNELCEDRHDFGDGKGMVPAYRFKNKIHYTDIIPFSPIGGWVAKSVNIKDNKYLYIDKESVVFGNVTIDLGVTLIGKCKIYGDCHLSRFVMLKNKELNSGYWIAD